MIPLNKQKEIITDFEKNEKNTVEASVHMNEQMFKLLSSGIYKNKIRALIRELLTNAVDSHVCSNNLEKEIDIKLPTALDPQFIVRDYGTGLSDEMVHKCFVSYGFSTKRESNDFNGQFGIGAKVTFAYSQSFVLISYFQGMKSIFTLYVNEKGIPSSTLIHKEETDEPNGIEIKISVFNEDFYQFENEARFVLSCFTKGKFNIKGISKPIQTLETNIVMLNDNIGYVNDIFINLDKFCIVQENVVYPLDFSRTKNLLSNVFGIEYQFGNLPLLFFVKNGEISYTASREDVEFTDENYSVIKQYLTDLKPNLDNFIKNNIEKISNQYEACKYYNNRVNFVSNTNLEKKLINDKGFYFGSTYQYDFNGNSDFVKDVKGPYDIEFKYRTDNFNLYYIPKRDEDGVKIGEIYKFNIEQSLIERGNVQIVVIDDKKHWRQKVTNNFKNGQKTLIIIKNYDYYKKHGLPKFFSDCGDDLKVEMISKYSFVQKERQKTGKWFTAYNSESILQPILLKTEHLEDIIEDDNDEFYIYYVKNRKIVNDFILNKEYFGPKKFLQFFDTDKKILCVSETRKNSVQKRYEDRSIDFFEEIIENIKKKYTFQDFEEFLLYNDPNHYISNNKKNKLRFLFEISKDFPFYEQFEKFQDFNKSEKDKEMKEIFETFDIYKIFNQNKKDIANILNIVYDYYNENYPIIIDPLSYSMIDKQKENIKQLLGVKND